LSICVVLIDSNALSSPAMTIVRRHGWMIIAEVQHQMMWQYVWRGEGTANPWRRSDRLRVAWVSVG